MSLGTAPRANAPIRPPSATLESARALDQAGRSPEAASAYRELIDATTGTDSTPVYIEALRRLAVIRLHEGELRLAIELCQTSFDVATAANDPSRAAEALNVLAGISFETGDLDRARALFLQAKELGRDAPGLWGRIEQNLGILASIHGDWTAAQAHYLRSLQAFETAGDERGAAMVFHNLGMISADREAWADADWYYDQSYALASRLGERQLQGLCRLNQAEASVAQARPVEALRLAEEALRVFEAMGSAIDKADGYRVIGKIYRTTGRTMLAESRLTASVDLARRTGAVLGEAEATRELALLYRAMGRNRETLELLNQAHTLFGRLGARREIVDVDAKVHDLEDTFLAVIQEWGQSIESADSYTFGHCERVANYGVAVAAALGLDAGAQKIIRLGAYLHDLGKVKVPHEILNKPGRLTDEEFAVIKRHPAWGVEMLEGIEFPWDIKPIIRSHHERAGGGGYPDGLSGEQIPLHAGIICVVDVWDALTTTRSYRPAMTDEQALAEMVKSRGWWRPDIYRAFEHTVPAITRANRA